MTECTVDWALILMEIEAQQISHIPEVFENRQHEKIKLYIIARIVDPVCNVLRYIYVASIDVL